MDGRRKSSLPQWLPALLCAGLTFAVSYLFALRGVDPHHDGWMLKAAVDVARGNVLYRDIYVQYGPLYVDLLALFVKLLGERVAALHTATCVAYALCALAMNRILRRFIPQLPAFLAPLVAIGLAAFYFWNFHPWSSVFVLLFSLLAAWAMVRYTETRRPLFALLSGLFTGCCFWCRQVALVTVLAGGLILLGLGLSGFAPKRALAKAGGCYLLGNLLVSGVCLVPMALTGALSHWWRQYILAALVFAAEPTAETAAKSPDSLLAYFLKGMTENPRYDWLWSVLTWGTLAYLLLLVLLVFTRKKNGLDRSGLFPRIAFAAFALSGWAYYFPTLCYRHLIWADYPMVGVMALALYDGVHTFLFSRKEKYAKEKATGVLDGAESASDPGPDRLAFRTGLIACALLLALCGSNLLLRARIGKSRLLGGGNGADFHTVEAAEEDTVLRYSRADYPYLNGLYLSNRETRFYDGLFSAMAAAQAAYPGRNVVNTTPNALFSLFVSDNVHPGSFGLTCDGYPEQGAVVRDYIQRNRPILISETLYDGYEALAYLSDYNGDAFRFSPLYVLIPKEVS